MHRCQQVRGCGAHRPYLPERVRSEATPAPDGGGCAGEQLLVVLNDPIPLLATRSDMTIVVDRRLDDVDFELVCEALLTDAIERDVFLAGHSDAPNARGVWQGERPRGHRYVKRLAGKGPSRFGVVPDCRANHSFGYVSQTVAIYSIQTRITIAMVGLVLDVDTHIQVEQVSTRTTSVTVGLAPMWRRGNSWLGAGKARIEEMAISEARPSLATLPDALLDVIRTGSVTPSAPKVCIAPRRPAPVLDDGRHVVPSLDLQATARIRPPCRVQSKRRLAVIGAAIVMGLAMFQQSALQTSTPSRPYLPDVPALLDCRITPTLSGRVPADVPVPRSGDDVNLIVPAGSDNERAGAILFTNPRCSFCAGHGSDGGGRS
ncbi:hypothetical protein PBRA_009311 [Plasmodiophora brassicae]|nr:hypothetical protein PBRA_009311 [Plasmodiophora brassicae]